MPTDRQHTGGTSNKRGTRYEDYFVVACLIAHAPGVLDQGREVRVKEQANCPIDDLVVSAPDRTLYHQLKTSLTETWTKSGGKLRRQFLAQLKECVGRGEVFQLVLVVPDKKRARRLQAKTPPTLARCTAVVRFPLLQRPGQLADLTGILGPAIASLRATRFSSRTEDEAIAGAFFLAYAEHLPDSAGWCAVADVLRMIRARGLARLRQRIPLTHPDWAVAEATLGRIKGLEWWVDRGYFEWRYRPTDTGLVGPLDGEPFRRFVDRIVKSRPETFEDFEGALP
jgi:hypothetical protein